MAEEQGMWVSATDTEVGKRWVTCGLAAPWFAWCFLYSASISLILGTAIPFSCAACTISLDKSAKLMALDSLVPMLGTAWRLVSRTGSTWVDWVSTVEILRVLLVPALLRFAGLLGGSLALRGGSGSNWYSFLTLWWSWFPLPFLSACCYRLPS